MKIKDQLIQIKALISKHQLTGWLLQHRRLALFAPIAVLSFGLALLFVSKTKSLKVAPYTATYQINTQITFGDAFNVQQEKVVVNHLNGRYKSQRYIDDIALLASGYNNSKGYFFCSYSQEEEFDCQRLGDALTKKYDRPPKVAGLTINPSTTESINVGGLDRPCRQTTYTLPTANPDASIQDLTATVCFDEQLKIPLTADLTVHYKVNDITEIKDLTIQQTRTLTELNLSPNFSEDEFNVPETN